jgi:hypothetical protein
LNRREALQREESPDTVVLGREVWDQRATRLVTPGGRSAGFGSSMKMGGPRRESGYGKCHREYTAGVICCVRKHAGKCLSVTGLEGNLRQAFSEVALGKGEKVG